MRSSLSLMITVAAMACAGPAPPTPPAVAPGVARLECPPGRGDCDGDPANGCEVDLTADPDNCHVCGLACRAAHTTAGCFAGECRIIACEKGWGDCDRRAENGCETSLCYTSHGYACLDPCPAYSY